MFYKLGDERVADFLLMLLHDCKLPRMRLLIKVHKTPVESRCICSGRNWITMPAQLLLGRYRQLITKDLPYVTTGSRHVLKRLPSHSPANILVAMDIRDLYPQIRVSLLKEFLWRQLLRKFSGLAALCGFLLHLFEIVMSAQYVVVDGRIYLLIDGLATGLSCAVELANMLLHEFDVYMNIKLSCCLYFRFVDDLLLATGELDVGNIMKVSNDWCESIRVTALASTKTGVFSDLCLYIDEGKLGVTDRD